MRALYSLMALALSASCSSTSADSPENTMNVDETLTTENIVDAGDPLPTPPSSHNYAFREGGTYGYIAAISEEDQKRGKAAGDVVMYIYRGKRGSVHRLEQVNGSGRIQLTAECDTPCVAIKIIRYGRVDRWAYNPDSIIGSAFQDAMNGYLTAAPEEVPETMPVAESPEPNADGNSVQVAQDPAYSEDNLSQPSQQ